MSYLSMHQSNESMSKETPSDHPQCGYAIYFNAVTEHSGLMS